MFKKDFDFVVYPVSENQLDLKTKNFLLFYTTISQSNLHIIQPIK